MLPTKEEHYLYILDLLIVPDPGFTTGGQHEDCNPDSPHPGDGVQHNQVSIEAWIQKCLQVGDVGEWAQFWIPIELADESLHYGICPLPVHCQVLNHHPSQHLVGEFLRALVKLCPDGVEQTVPISWYLQVDRKKNGFWVMVKIKKKETFTDEVWSCTYRPRREVPFAFQEVLEV